jgi:hypothetical protein
MAAGELTVDQLGGFEASYNRYISGLSKAKRHPAVPDPKPAPDPQPAAGAPAPAGPRKLEDYDHATLLRAVELLEAMQSGTVT